VLQEAAKPEAAPFVIFHDYQLYLAPAMVRRARPDLTLMHFTHIPWPESQAWRKLPAEWVRSICAALLDCDIVGLQTIKDVKDFVQTCQEFLEGVSAHETAEDSYQLEYRPPNQPRRRSLARAYPISIDPALVRETFQDQVTQKWRDRLAKFRPKGVQLIVRVDRLDPNKNILAGFEAYARLLEERPEFRESVNFLALMVPTRESVPEYAAYKKRVFNLIRKLNRRYGAKAWRPVHYFYGNDYRRALAALSLADVVLVNSLADGMNLVAKEATIVNDQNGMLVLSRQAGAWEELGEYALGVEAGNTEDTARKLAEALTLPAAHRAEHATQLARTVEDNDLANWLAAQLWDLGQARKNLSLA
jgi:trehalose 6-phosphate synthase